MDDDSSDSSDDDDDDLGFRNEREHASLPRLSRTRWGKKLTAMGFDWGETNPRDRRYRLLFAALEAYVGEAGDAVVPRNFRIPRREPYPKELYDVNLDRAVYCLKFYRDHVAAYPERQAALRSLGFVWQRLQPEFNLIVEALVSYKNFTGHLRVPVAFVVPINDDAWPVAIRGMPLGQLCAQIRSRHDFVGGADRWKQLNDHGYVWGQHHDKSRLFEALDQYRHLTGTLEPPVRYVVPLDDDRWPRHLRGFQLGRRRYDTKRREEQTKDKHLMDRRFDDFARALTVFVLTYGHADVPQKFIVPAMDDRWPPDCAGMPLGQRVAQIRSKRYYVADGDSRAHRRKQILDELGFIWQKQPYKTTTS